LTTQQTISAFFTFYTIAYRKPFASVG